MRRASQLGPLVMLGAILVGCVHSQHAADDRGLTVGKKGLDVEGQDAEGAPFHLASLRGNVVLLDFWLRADRRAR